MHIPTLFTLLLTLLTTTVIAKHSDGNSTQPTTVTAKHSDGNSTQPTTDKSLCKEMAHLEKLVNQAQNTTKLATKTHNNQTKIDEVVAEASSAAVQLDTMQQNATLVGVCNGIESENTVRKQCGKMEDLQKTIDTASNTTKLATKSHGNATKEAEFQDKAAKAQVKLESMMSNATLVDACSNLKAEKEKEKGDSTTTTTGAAAAESSGAKTNGASGDGLGVRGMGGMGFGSLIAVGLLVIVGMEFL